MIMWRKLRKSIISQLGIKPKTSSDFGARTVACPQRGMRTLNACVHKFQAIWEFRTFADCPGSLNIAGHLHIIQGNMWAVCLSQKLALKLFYVKPVQQSWGDDTHFSWRNAGIYEPPSHLKWRQLLCSLREMLWRSFRVRHLVRKEGFDEFLMVLELNTTHEKKNNWRRLPTQSGPSVAMIDRLGVLRILRPPWGFPDCPHHMQACWVHVWTWELWMTRNLSKWAPVCKVKGPGFDFSRVIIAFPQFPSCNPSVLSIVLHIMKNPFHSTEAP